MQQLSHMQADPEISDTQRNPTVLYTERLYPSVGAWTASAFVPLAAILIFLPIAPLTGVAVAVALAIVMAAFWLTSAPRITITEAALHAGKASIDRGYLGAVEPFRLDTATAERGTNLNGKAYLLVRAWIDPVVKIQITDVDDPHPYWLLSTRNPEVIARILDYKG